MLIFLLVVNVERLHLLGYAGLADNEHLLYQILPSHFKAVSPRRLDFRGRGGYCARQHNRNLS